VVGRQFGLPSGCGVAGRPTCRAAVRRRRLRNNPLPVARILTVGAHRGFGDQPLTGFGYEYWFACTGCGTRVNIAAELYELQCTNRAGFSACSCGIEVDITSESPTLRNVNDVALQNDSAARVREELEPIGPWDVVVPKFSSEVVRAKAVLTIIRRYVDSHLSCPDASLSTALNAATVRGRHTQSLRDADKPFTSRGAFSPESLPPCLLGRT
jgi:hypothetical protein